MDTKTLGEFVKMAEKFCHLSWAELGKAMLFLLVLWLMFTVPKVKRFRIEIEGGSKK